MVLVVTNNQNVTFILHRMCKNSNPLCLNCVRNIFLYLVFPQYIRMCTKKAGYSLSFYLEYNVCCFNITETYFCEIMLHLSVPFVTRIKGNSDQYVIYIVCHIVRFQSKRRAYGVEQG